MLEPESKTTIIECTPSDPDNPIEELFERRKKRYQLYVNGVLVAESDSPWAHWKWEKREQTEEGKDAG